MVTVNIFGTLFHLKQLRAARFKKGWTVMHILPWSKYAQHLAGRRGAIPRVNEAFAKAGEMTGGLPLRQRMEIISYAMKGQSFGGAKRALRPAVGAAEVEKKKADVRAAVAALAVAAK